MQDLINAIQSKIDDLEKRIVGIENILSQKNVEQQIGVQKKMSIKEFILEKKPTNDIQKTLVISYYLEHFDNITPFNTEDIEKGFRLAKETLPLNINDRVNSNIHAGYIMEHTEKKNGRKSWLVTASGERFVESGFKK